jgi:uncharacterized protein with PIN domain
MGRETTLNKARSKTKYPPIGNGPQDRRRWLTASVLTTIREANYSQLGSHLVAGLGSQCSFPNNAGGAPTCDGGNFLFRTHRELDGRKMPLDAKDENEATFRFYAELNDFLPPSHRSIQRPYRFGGKPSVKDAIEALGVPHTEVELILVNGVSVGFDYHLCSGDRIAVYPVFETLDIASLVLLRERPLRDIRFVLDVHLGKLARWLRLVGFDALYRADLEDSEVAELSVREKRVVLTRDVGLLQRKAITHGYWVRAEDPEVQIVEVLRRFQLDRSLRPFQRCLDCNGCIEPVDKAEVWESLEPKTRQFYQTFYRCANCKKVYWAGSHYSRMLARLKRVIGLTDETPKMGLG